MIVDLFKLKRHQYQLGNEQNKSASKYMARDRDATGPDVEASLALTSGWVHPEDSRCEEDGVSGRRGSCF